MYIVLDFIYCNHCSTTMQLTAATPIAGPPKQFAALCGIMFCTLAVLFYLLTVDNSKLDWVRGLGTTARVWVTTGGTTARVWITTRAPLPGFGSPLGLHCQGLDHHWGTTARV